MPAVGLAPQRLGCLDEIVNATLALGQVGAVDIADAMGNPVHDQRLRPGAPQGAVDPVAPGVNHVQPARRGRIPDLDGQGRARAQTTFGCGQPDAVAAGRRELRGGRQGAGIGERHLSRPGGFAPRNPHGRRIALDRLDRSGQVGPAIEHHAAIDARRHHGRKCGRLPRIIDPPLEHARRESLARIHLQTQPRGGHLVKSRRVESIPFHPQARGVRHRHELDPVPILQPAGAGQTHPLAVVPPIDLDPPRADRLAPVVLDPLAAHPRPVAIGPAAVVPRAAGDMAVVQGIDRGVAGGVRAGWRGDQGKVGCPRFPASSLGSQRQRQAHTQEPCKARGSCRGRKGVPCHRMRCFKQWISV